MSRRNGRVERGAAVLVAMLLAALAAIIAVTVFADEERWMRNVQHRRDQVQAQAIAIAGVQWARQILYDDARTSAIDHLGEPWALQLPPIPLDNGEIRGAVRDAQSRLDVNALADEAPASAPTRARIARLFAQQHGPVAALPAIEDWLDADAVARPGGAEDGPYRSEGKPFVPPNAPVLRVAELSLVRGVAPEALAAIEPFVTALPLRAAVNVNTAPPEVLAAVLDGASSEAITALLETRRVRPFATIADFRARLPAGVQLATEQGLSVSSDFFEISVEARQGNTVARARALVRRRPDQWPAIVWQVTE